MKLLNLFSGMLLIIFSSSCSTYQRGISSEADDRYYSLNDAKIDQREARKLNSKQPSSFAEVPQSNNSEQSDYTDPNYQRIPDANNYTPNNGETVINNYYNDGYDIDNYYDYMYASRIRRFHRNSGNFGYYDPFFTNTYFYNNNPLFFGNSIYSTYGFYNPYVPWGFNNWGGQGLNIGWNSFSGFYMNYNMGWNNPYNMFNNPWRWNTWGYNPWMSPFAYNPWACNPYGFGMNNWSNGYAFGYSNALMYNNMMNNSVYYNSYDNNTFNNTSIVNNYGPNYNGAGGGSSYKSDQSLSSVFSKEIGQNLSAVHANEVKGTQNLSTGPGKNTGNASVVSGTSVAPGKQSGATVSGQPVSSDGKTQPGKQGGSVVSGQAVISDGNTQSGKQNQVTSVSGTEVSPSNSNPKGSSEAGVIVTNGNGKNNSVKAESFNDVKGQQQVPSQSGKQDLIQQGKANSTAGSTKPQPSASNYNSAPVKGTQAAQENTPSSARPSNISPSNYDSPKTQEMNSGSNSIRSGNDAKPQPYSPNYDYSNGVKANGDDARGNYQVPNNNQPKVTNPTNGQPSTQAPIRNSQQYQTPNQSAPKQPIQAPVNNYQRYQSPNQSVPKQQNQVPSNNYQQYQAPRQDVPNNYQPSNNSNSSAPRQQYQAPVRQYDTPRQNNQPKSSPSPSQQYQSPRNQNTAPAQNSPSRQYQAPAQSAPRQQQSAPKQSSPRQSFSSPSQSSPRSSNPSMKSSSPSGNTGGKTSSPRR